MSFIHDHHFASAALIIYKEKPTQSEDCVLHTKPKINGNECFYLE